MKRGFVLAGCVLIAVLARPVAAHASDERLERLTPEHRVWLEEEVVYIITEREREFFLTLETAEEREYFVEAFWRKRDPNPNTPVNEFKEEHYRRFEFANRSLGFESTKPGWRTDRGKMYILLGEPRERQRYDGLNEIVSTELWFYQSERGTGLPSFFYLVFFRPRDIGEFRLYHPALDGPRSLLRGRYASLETYDHLEMYSTLNDITPELARASLSLDPSDPGDTRTGRVSLGTDILMTRIDDVARRRIDTDYVDAASHFGRRVSADYSFNYVPNQSVFLVLPGPEQNFLVHYSVEFAPQDFALETDEQQSTYYTTLDATLEVHDTEDNLVHSEDSQIYVELSRAQFDQVNAFPFAFQNSFPLVPGTFNVSLLLKNRVVKKFTMAERTIEVPSVDDGSPSLGDPIGAFDVEALESVQAGAFIAGTHRFRPAADGLFALGDPLIVGAQVSDAEPNSTLRITLSDSDVILQEKLVHLGEAPSEVVAEKLDLSSIEPGAYVLDIELGSHTSPERVRRSTSVQVTPRTAIARASYVHRGGFDAATPGLVSLTSGNQFWAMKRFEDARRELERAVAADNPELPMARWKLASVYLRTGEPDAAIELLAPLENSYPSQYEVIVGLGFAHYFKRDFADAIRYLDRALGIRPASPALLNALGESYEQTDDLENAAVFFERSLALQPNQTVIQERLAALKAQAR